MHFLTSDCIGKTMPTRIRYSVIRAHRKFLSYSITQGTCLSLILLSRWHATRSFTLTSVWQHAFDVVGVASALLHIINMSWLLYRVGFWFRETGQALDRVGCRLQGNTAFVEECMSRDACTLFAYADEL